MPSASRRSAAVPKRVIVVDACVAQSAGLRSSPDATSRRCRNCLDAILEVCHSVVMNDELRREWDDHESLYAAFWLQTMRSKRKCRRTSEIANGVVDELHKHVEPSSAAAKDLHLLVSALATDAIVISRDDEARRNLARCCGDIPGVGGIVWACPEHEAGIIEWLEQGAPKKPEWTLARA